VTADYLPTAPWKNLRLRAELLSQLRRFFADRDFLDVETPLLSADIVVDRHLDPFSTLLAPDPKRPNVGRRLWMQTSPEFGMKRLLAAARDDADAPRAIYQITRSFRNGEQGDRHNPEFTIVEWYRLDETYDAAMQLTDELCQTLLDRGPAERLTYAQAFLRHAGIDPHAATIDDLRAAAMQNGIEPPSSLGPNDRDAWLNLLLATVVEPHLGVAAPTILCDYPASQAALARVRPGPPRVAERFELYVAGIELANGYHELLDADELQSRIVQANAQRVADGKPALPADNRLLAAMRAGLPPCCGVALGFDRLVMLAAGATTLSDVIPFPIDRA
jgi:elongation factor P--(R)-beta-lysine ligase